MCDNTNEIKTRNVSVGDFVNISATIFKSNLGITAGIMSSKEQEKDRMTGTNIKIIPDESKSDNYQFMGSYCPYCDFRPKTRRPEVLEVHMRTHTGDKPFSCAICDFSTATKFYLETHMRKHTGEKPFNCPTCEYSASRKDTLRIHMLTHTNEKPFVCTECSFKCARQKGLQQHWSFHCKFEHFRCSVCDYKCRKSTDLSSHLLTHPAVISCPKCDYVGRCIEDLDKHNLIHNKTVKKRVWKKRARSEEKFICAKCGITLSHRSSLVTHILKNRCK